MILAEVMGDKGGSLSVKWETMPPPMSATPDAQHIRVKLLPATTRQS